MALYTFVMDFRGGTYISQVEAEDLHASIPAWIEAISKQQNQILHLGTKGLEKLKEELADQNPTLLDSLQNVWCLTAHLHSGFALINVVKTEKKDE